MKEKINDVWISYMATLLDMSTNKQTIHDYLFKENPRSLNL